MPTVAIIGASRGIGLGFVEAYAADGWTVHATTRTPNRPGKLGDVTGDVTLHEMDVVNPDHVAAMADALAGVALDVLIHNAGVYGDGMSRDEVMGINAFAPIEVVEALLPAVQRGSQKKAAILTSQMGARHGGGMPSGVYGASKAMLNDNFRRHETTWRRHGIAAVVFHPGWVKTDMGGRGASVTVRDSVAGMRKVLAGLTQADSGKFLTWQGREHAW
jgi:NAD(P)-dependent dehydrogenase (short-subunit alcohol dehydrogenase family)